MFQSLQKISPGEVIFFVAILLLNRDKLNQVVGQTVNSVLETETTLYPVHRLFLQPCEVTTLQTQCTDEEYETNEDCLPQKKDNCDRSRELFCLSGVCLPNCHPLKETYDRDKGKCFRKVNSDCRPNNGTTKANNIPGPAELSTKSSSYDNGGSEEENQQHSTVTVPECVPHAICVKGQCKCAKNFTHDPLLGRCVQTAEYNNFCNDTITCGDIKFSDVICKENQCQCKSAEIQYFHTKRKRCYILLGEVCSSGLQFCPDNSNCVRNKRGIANNGTNLLAKQENSSILFISPSPSTPEEKQYQESDKGIIYDWLRVLYEERLNNGEEDEKEYFIGIWTEDGEEEREFSCSCMKGYGSTRDRKWCLGLHGSRCNTLHRCNLERGLKCIDGVCLCGREKGNEQIFSEQFQTCITKIGAPCLESGKGEREPDICPIGGSCREEKCVCDKGGLMAGMTKASQTGEWIAYSCMKSHGMPCKSNSSNVSSSWPAPQGTDLFEPPCNHEIGLECNTKEGKCLCRDSNQFYDVRMKTCRNFQNIDAKIPVIHFTPPDDREYNFKKNSSSQGNTISSIFSISQLGYIFIFAVLFLHNILYLRDCFVIL